MPNTTPTHTIMLTITVVSMGTLTSTITTLVSTYSGTPITFEMVYMTHLLVR